MSKSKAISVRIEQKYIDALEKIEEFFTCSLSDAIKISIIECVQNHLILKYNVQLSEALAYELLELTRDKSKQNKEVKCAFINLKNSLMRFMIRGSSPERVFEILQSEKKRIDLCLSDLERKQLNKWKLKDIKIICSMVARAKENHFKNSEIFDIGFDTFRNLPLEDLKKLNKEDKKIVEYVEK